MALPTSHLYVLIALAEEDRHGYAIMTAAREAGASLGPGALYAALGRLLDSRMIAEIDERPAPELDDARRRYYRITPGGRAAMTAELDRLHAVIDRATRGTGWRPGVVPGGA